MSTIPQEAVYIPDDLYPEQGCYQVDLGMVSVELDHGRNDWFVEMEGRELDAANIKALRSQLGEADRLRRNLNDEPGSDASFDRATAEHARRDAAFLAEYGHIIQPQAPAWATDGLDEALSDSPWPEIGNEVANFIFRAKLGEHFELFQTARFDPRTGVLELVPGVGFAANISDEEYTGPAPIVALINETLAALTQYRAVL